MNQKRMYGGSASKAARANKTDDSDSDTVAGGVKNQSPAADSHHNVIILSEHPYEALKSDLVKTYQSPDVLTEEIKKSLLRLLEYKELLLHKDVLDPKVLDEVYSHLSIREKEVVDRGLEEISSAIIVLDGLVSS